MKESSQRLSWLTGEFEFLYFNEADEISDKIKQMLLNLMNHIPEAQIEPNYRFENGLFLDGIIKNLHPLPLTTIEQCHGEADELHDNPIIFVTVDLPKHEKKHHLKVNKWRERCIAEFSKNDQFIQLMNNYLINSSANAISEKTHQILASFKGQMTLDREIKLDKPSLSDAK